MNVSQRESMSLSDSVDFLKQNLSAAIELNSVT